MSMNDLISDLATRIRNAQAARLATTVCTASRMAENILKVLEAEGYIRGFNRKEIRKGVEEIVIELKYYEGAPVIHEIKRVSSPGRRAYSPIKTLKSISNGLGISILSTSKGVMSDTQAREQNVGGEVLCTVF